MNDGATVGAIAPARTVSLSVTNLQQLPVGVRSAEVQRLAAEEARHSFDLTNSPLLRVGLLQQSPESHVLLVTIPQIVGDRSSIAIFIQELATLYQAFSKGLPSPLPELSIQYADVARQQRQSFGTEVFGTQLDYWKQQLKSAPPQERLVFMLSDSRASVLLTQQDLLSGLAEHEARVVLLDANSKAIAQKSQENPLVSRYLSPYYRTTTNGNSLGRLWHCSHLWQGLPKSIPRV